MAKVTFTSALKRFFPGLKSIEVTGSTVSEVVQTLEKEYPGLTDYILDEGGSLRQHVNIFVGEELIQDKETLQDQVSPNDEIYILQALSGG
ncbi:MAG: MoaD/ThiS family protein [Bacteroidota bacterium]